MGKTLQLIHTRNAF